MKRSRLFLSTVLSIGFLISLLMYTGCNTGPVESFELRVFEQTGDSGGAFRPASRLRLKENPDVEADFEGTLVRNEDGFASSEYSVVYPEEGDDLEGEGAVGFY